MRVSTSTMTNMATNSMSNSYDTYLDIINKITSNKNFTSVSENVTDATRLLKVKDQLAKLDEYQSNIQAATNEMNMAYDALSSITDEINAINSLVVEASNATTTPTAAKAIAAEIEQRITIITDKMNTKYLDNYIFSGTFTNQMTYAKDADGNYVYQGSSLNASDRNLTISENTSFKYNITAEEIFGKTEYNDDGSIKTPAFFDKMKSLVETLRDPNGLDYDKIRAEIKTLEEATDKVTLSQGNISAKVTKLDTTQTINEDTITKLTEERVNIEEVDITKAATDLANAQTALQASYLIGTSILGSVSLLDYL